MTPPLPAYYRDAHVVIYHGDCREIIPQLLTSGVVTLDSLLLTDPPYGADATTMNASVGRGRLTAAHDYPPISGDKEPFNPEHLLDFKRAVLWGANYYADKLPASPKWLVWDKRDGDTSNDQADCELAWTHGTGTQAVRIFRHLWKGMLRASERHERRYHGSQKPLALMSWCMTHFTAPAIVFDPYIGSGTTLVAAKRQGLYSVGIDREQWCCDAAVERLRQNTLF